MSFTTTRSSTFTITNARYLTSKIAADMHLCANYYGRPSEQSIRDYAEELAQLLNDGYVEKYEFGYERNDQRIVCWHYKVDSLGLITTDDRPGKLVSTVETVGASFYNHLWYSSAWFELSLSERERIEFQLPVKRVTGPAPTDGVGYWTSDKNYFSGGKGFSRQTFRPY